MGTIMMIGPADFAGVQALTPGTRVRMKTASAVVMNETSATMYQPKGSGPENSGIPEPAM
jgi:hypothetical protein